MEHPPVATETQPQSFFRRYGMFIGMAVVMLAGLLIGGGNPHAAVALGPVKLDLIIFAAVLLAIVFKDTFAWEPRDIALVGLSVEIGHQLYMGTSLLQHLRHDDWHEGLTFGNIFTILLGFTLLAVDFKGSLLPKWLPAILPDDWKGGACILIFVTIISAGLDNIAAAMIGGAIAKTVFNNRVCVGYVAAIVACSNAGGAGSVIGDTTTTMMWIDGVNPLDVLHAFVGSLGAVAIVIPLAARQQHRYQPIVRDALGGISLADIRWSRMIAVVITLAGCIAANMTIGLPAVGVWVGLLVTQVFLKRGKEDWAEVRHMVNDAVFITCLVALASLMPVKDLPQASATVAFVLGCISSIFDNIPLTKLALVLGGYDWGLLAFAVGYGGSMTWFGSSAGVAISNEFPEAKNVRAWIVQGWYVVVGYIVGFGLMMLVFGWQPHTKHRPDSTDHSVAPATSATPLFNTGH